MKPVFSTRQHLLSASLLSIALLMTSCSGAEDRENKYLARADKYYVEHNFAKAKVEIKNVLQINAKNSKARVLLARVNQSEGDYRQSIANFTLAAEEDANQVEARIELAKIYISANRNTEAEKFLSEALALEPKNNEAKALSAGIHMRKGEKEEALRIANEVLAADPGNAQATAVIAAMYLVSDPELALEKINQGLLVNKTNAALQLLKIEVLRITQKFDQIEPIFESLIENNPHNFAFYDQLASIHLANKKPKEAEAVVRKAIDNNPDSMDPVLALVSFIQKTQGVAESEAILKEFVGKKPNNYLLKKALVNIYLQQQKFAEANEILTSVIAKDTKSADALSARVDLARVHLAQKDKVKANALLDEVFAIEASNSEARLLSARLKLADNRLKDAIADLRTVLKSDNKSLEGYQLLAGAQERDGTPAMALESYYQALNINSNDLVSLLGAANLSIKDKKNDTGKKLLERVLAIDPTNAQALLMLSNLMMENKDWDTAAKYCQILIDNDSVAKKATGYNAMGGVLSAQSKWEPAKQNFTEALSLSPKSYAPLAGIVNALLAQSKTSEAIGFVENHLKANPEFPAAQRLLAKLYASDKKPQRAIEIYESLISTTADETLYESLAGIYFDQKNLKAAEATYLRGLERIPNSVSLRAFLGNFYVADKRFEEAKQQYEAAYEKMPTADAIRNNLAILLINNFPSEDNFKKALDLVSGFSTSKEPNYLDTLGWAQYHMGNFPQAISYLQQAITIKSSSEYHYHLGMTFAKNNQPADAKKELLLATKDTTESPEWLPSAKKTLSTL